MSHLEIELFVLEFVLAVSFPHSWLTDSVKERRKDAELSALVVVSLASLFPETFRDRLSSGTFLSGTFSAAIHLDLLCPEVRE